LERTPMRSCHRLTAYYVQIPEFMVTRMRLRGGTEARRRRQGG